MAQRHGSKAEKISRNCARQARGCRTSPKSACKKRWRKPASARVAIWKNSSPPASEVNGKVAELAARSPRTTKCAYRAKRWYIKMARPPAAHHHLPQARRRAGHPRRPEGRVTVFERLPQTQQQMVAVGWLDLNTSGLVLDHLGRAGQPHDAPQLSIEREYAVRTLGELTPSKCSRPRAAWSWTTARALSAYFRAGRRRRQPLVQGDSARRPQPRSAPPVRALWPDRQPADPRALWQPAPAHHALKRGQFHELDEASVKVEMGWHLTGQQNPDPTLWREPTMSKAFTRRTRR